MSRLKWLITEIHRRSLWQVLLIYIGAAWACFELIATVADTMGLPGWLPGLAIVLFLLGLPFVVATALVREEPAPSTVPPAATEAEAERAEVEAAAARREATRRHRFLTWRNAGLSFLVALAVWGVVATGWMLFGKRPTTEEADAGKSIAVLPFDNIGGAKENVAFTDGIHDDIITQLQKIGDLTPISRTSVMGYRGTNKNLRLIAGELGVATVLEGGVQRSGNRVRINVQLIGAETDEHLWAETYEEVLTAENVFAIQTAIAQRIASALKAQLSPEESERIAALPTENLEAYEHLMRGGAYFRRGRAARAFSPERLALEDSAIAEYERAVELDPEFSAAWAALAGARMSVAFEGRDVERDRQEDRERGERALARAVELAPESYETHIAQAQYYTLLVKDQARAERHLRVAEALRPNEPELLHTFGNALLFQGKWEEGLSHHERRAKLDPQNAGAAVGLAMVYRRMGRFSEAERYLDRAIVLDPSGHYAYQLKFTVLLFGLGDTAEARVFAEEHPDELRAEEAWPHHIRREHERELDILRSRDPGASIRILHALYLSGRSAETRAYADSMARELEEPSSESLIDAARYRSHLGRAYAFAGKIDAAIREAEAALGLYPRATDEWNRHNHIMAACDVYILAGEYEAAIDQLEVLLSYPSGITMARLKVDHFYDPLRDHPRFQALLERYK